MVARDSAVREKRLLPLTLVILVLAFGALVAAALPLIVGVLAITVSLAIIGLIAHVTPMSVFVLNMTTMIGLGVGIDYSLLVVTRFREELARGARRQIAAVNALATAGRAVITSGLTVVVGFGALLLTPLIETRSVGIGGLIVVAVAVSLSITLLPALLAILGPRDRSAQVARASARLVPRAAGVGEVGAHPEPAPDPRHDLWRRRDRDPDAARSSSSRSGCPRAIGGRPAPRRATGSTS